VSDPVPVMGRPVEPYWPSPDEAAKPGAGADIAGPGVESVPGAGAAVPDLWADSAAATSRWAETSYAENPYAETSYSDTSYRETSYADASSAPVSPGGTPPGGTPPGTSPWAESAGIESAWAEAARLDPARLDPAGPGPAGPEPASPEPAPAWGSGEASWAGGESAWGGTAGSVPAWGETVGSTAGGSDGAGAGLAAEPVSPAVAVPPVSDAGPGPYAVPDPYPYPNPYAAPRSDPYPTVEPGAHDVQSRAEAGAHDAGARTGAHGAGADPDRDDDWLPVPSTPPRPASALDEALAAELAALTHAADELEAAPEPEPWDRRPLMVVLASAAALVVLAVLSGVTAAALAGPGTAAGVWRSAASGGPTAVPSGTPEGGAGDEITLMGVGDVIMGSQPDHVPARGGQGMFDQVRSSLAADLVMGNLETPLTPDTGMVKCGLETPAPTAGNPSPSPTRVSGCYQFYLPPSYANRLHEGGFTLMNLANNHTFDMGAKGLQNTRSALDSAGVKYTGGPTEITYVDVRGIRVAVVGFSVYSWGANLNNIPAAQALVRKAAASADVVVVQMQGGAEGADRSHVKPGHEIYFGEDRGDLMAFAHAVIDAGADVIFGHGPHIMRGMEFYKGRLIAYSLGNFTGYGVLSSAGYLGVGGILKVTLHKDGSWAGGTLIPTQMVKGGMPAPDPGHRAWSFVDGLSRNDFGGTAAHISASDGTLTPATA
jgi:hypothetical protein